MVQIKPLTAQEVCSALGLSDYNGFDSASDGPSAVQIAADMLNGVVEFEQEELARLAAFRGITVSELLQGEQFGGYR